MSDGQHRYLHGSDGSVRRSTDPADQRVSAKDFVLDSSDTPLVFVTDNNGEPNQFIDKARQLVVEKYNRDLYDVSDGLLTIDEVFVVWFSKVLKNWKALVSTDRSDGRYYELTHNGEREETYIDVYSKTHNEVIRDVDR